LPSGASADLSFRTVLVAGTEQILPLSIGATVSCDAGLTTSSVVPFTATVAGGRLAMPLEALNLRPSPGGLDDEARGLARDAAGNIFTAGYSTNTQGASGRDWRITKYDAMLGTVLATTTYDGPLGGGF